MNAIVKKGWVPRGNARETNIYSFDGDIGIGLTTNTKQPFYFDKEDFDLIKNYNWAEHKQTDGYRALEAYNITRNPIGGRHIRFHWLLGYKGADHIDRNPFNNRKSNLRFVSKSVQVINRGKQKNNKTGIIGVTYLEKRSAWIANIKDNKKNKCLGTFKVFDDAVRARLTAEAIYYGEYAPQKHLFEQYNIAKELIEKWTTRSLKNC